MRREVADAFYREALGVSSPHRERIGIFEPERRDDEDAVLRVELARDLAEQALSIGPRLAFVEDGGVERPRVIDIGVDLFGPERVEDHRRAERLQGFDGQTRLAPHAAGEDAREDVALREGLGADDDGRLFARKCGPERGRGAVRGEQRRIQQRQTKTMRRLRRSMPIERPRTRPSMTSASEAEATQPTSTAA